MLGGSYPVVQTQNQIGGKKREKEVSQEHLMMLQTIVLLITYNRVSDLRWKSFLSISAPTTSLCHEMYDEIIRAAYTRSHV